MTGVFGTLAIPSLICLAAGLVLLVVEMCLPGFGAPGISGCVCLAAAVVMQFAGNTLRGALIFTAAVFVLVALMLVLLLRSLGKGKLSGSAIVNRTSVKEEDKEPMELIGKTGTVLTPLRPTGIAEVEGQRLNVETDSTYLPAGTKVQITEVKGLRILVHEIL